MSYMDLYSKRLNRFGQTYQERVQSEREKLFDMYLQKSTYQAFFEYDKKVYIGSLEKYQQTASKDLHYLLTQIDLQMPSGTLLNIKDIQGIEDTWMIFWLEDLQASGYNRYVVLRMTHDLTWTKVSDHSEITGKGYLWGPQDAVIRDEVIKAGRRFRYVEENESRYIIMPRDKNIVIGDYVVVSDGNSDYDTNYRVTGFDWQSVPGVEYVTLDPIFEYNFTEPESKETDTDDETFWINGGQS